MKRSRITEVHFICPFDNFASVIEHGIVCKIEQRKRFPHARSVALEGVQDQRALVVIPQGGKLHSYANLYFDARNAMMSKLRSLNSELAIVRVSHEVVDLPNVIVSDRNAAAYAANFRPAAEGVPLLKEEEVYAEWWNESIDAKQKRCAEVLVPTEVPPEYIQGAYVLNATCKATLENLAPSGFTFSVNGHLYF